MSKSETWKITGLWTLVVVGTVCVLIFGCMSLAKIQSTLKVTENLKIMDKVSDSVAVLSSGTVNIERVADISISTSNAIVGLEKGAIRGEIQGISVNNSQISVGKDAVRVDVSNPQINVNLPNKTLLGMILGAILVLIVWVLAIFLKKGGEKR